MAIIRTLNMNTNQTSFTLVHKTEAKLRIDLAFGTSSDIFL